MADWSARLYQADCLDVMRSLDAASVDAVVTDPPYEIGFMGRSWDNAGIAYSTEMWDEALRVLKPGGHLLAFGATRTYHRMAVAIEDAGFEIRDSLHYIYGSGFPKSLDVGKAIDGLDRSWHGWGTALKPAHEPIVMARKQLGGTVVRNVLSYGTGALNIAAARIGSGGGTRDTPNGVGIRSNEVYGEYGSCSTAAIDDGRWPSNVLLAHLSECEGSGVSHTGVLCAPGCPVAELNEASGQSASASALMPLPKGHAFAGETYGGDSSGRDEQTVRGFDDAGGAARFFWVAKPRKREKIGGTTRNLHPTVKPIDLMRYLVRLVTPPNGVVLDPFAGSGSTGCAAMVEAFRFIGCEMEAESYETMVARCSDYAFVHGRPKPERCHLPSV